MLLGAFSVSLNVKDIQVSKVFYEKLGFEQFGGDETQNWLIMKNGDHIIGLFQGMFEGNILTFNPGWDQNGQLLDWFDDVRLIQKNLLEKGVELKEQANPDSKGRAHLSLLDPDGNAILIDQHVE